MFMVQHLTLNIIFMITYNLLEGSKIRANFCGEHFLTQSSIGDQGRVSVNICVVLYLLQAELSSNRFSDKSYE